MNNFFALFHSAVAIMTLLLFAATGGLFCDRAGMLNIALEGLLLTGAFFAAAAFNLSGSFTLALAAAVFAALFLSCVMAFAALNLRSNVFIAGLAANLLAGGGTVVLSDLFFNTKGVVVLRAMTPLPVWHVPLVRDIPVLGRLFSGHSWFSYAAFFLLFVSWLVLCKTPFGRRLCAAGIHEEALASLGHKPDFYRFTAFLISGFCCGLGGAALSLNLGAFVPNMSAGKGWIALVVIFLGGHKCSGLLAAAFVFGLAEAFSNYAQGLFNVPADFILAIPYIFTLVSMIAVSVYTRRRDIL